MLRSKLLPLLAPALVGLFTVAATLSLVTSCGDDSSSDAKPDATGKVGDAAQPFTLAVTTGPLVGSSVTVPAGGLPAGSTVNVSAGVPPPSFTSNAEATLAGAALKLDVSGPDGKALAEATAPLTLGITFNEATVGLYAVGKAVADLCVFQAASNGSFYVYRDTSIVVDAAAKVVAINTKLFGTFQVVFCGDLVLAGFLDAAAVAKPADPVTPAPVEPTPTTPAPTAPDPAPAAGAVGEFFTAIAGTYEYKAVNTRLSADAKWTNGTTYAIVITAGGVVTIPTDTVPLVLTYGEAADDKVEAYPNETYAVMNRGAEHFLLNRQQLGGQEPKLFMTWSTGQDDTLVFFRFDAVGPTGDEGPLGERGVPFVDGSYKVKVTAAEGNGDQLFQVGTAYEFVISPLGVVSGAFGEFVLLPNMDINKSTQGGIEKVEVKYFRGTKGSAPRDDLVLQYEDGVFKGGRHAVFETGGLYKTYTFATEP